MASVSHPPPPLICEKDIVQRLIKSKEKGFGEILQKVEAVYIEDGMKQNSGDLGPVYDSEPETEAHGQWCSAP